MNLKSSALPTTWQQLCNDVYDALIDAHYSEFKKAEYKNIYRRLLNYLHATKRINLAIHQKHIDAFLDSIGILGCQSSEVSGPRQVLIKAMRILMEYHQTGTFLHRKQRIDISHFPKSYKNLLSQYLLYRIEEKECTCNKSVGNTIRYFFNFLIDNKIKNINRIRPKHVHAYIKTFSGLSRVTVSDRIHILHNFFKYLDFQGLIVPELAKSLPHVRELCRRKRLADVWPKSTIHDFIATIDRKTALGKRDYAISVLIARFGLRVGDVRAMQFENIDWRKSTIVILQQKTQVPLELPLSGEIGNALIDYIQNGRPNTSIRNLFVSHRTPHGPLKNNLYGITERYRKKAGITLPEGCRKGFHALRHSIATRLHEESTPLPVIAALLGHTSLESARFYTRTNTEMLRSVSLDWEGDQDE